MNRRLFLIGSAGLALESLLTACGGANRPQVRIQLLKNSVPARLLKAFKQQTTQPVNLVFENQPQLLNLFQQLQRWQAPAMPNRLPSWLPNLPLLNPAPPMANQAVLVTLGDYWLAAAIQQKLIQPLAIADLAGWQQLSPQWQELVKRDRTGQPATSTGAIWGAPYRWGSLMMVYRQDVFERLGWQPEQWQDLWHADLNRQIALPNHPRLVLGLILKSLGLSCNPTNTQQTKQVNEALSTLHRQVRLYTSDSYLQALVSNDLYLAVGWSMDILPIIKQYKQLRAVIPSPGTLLSADLWVSPAPNATTASEAQPVQGDVAQQWIDFYWQVPNATELSVATLTPSPLFTHIDEPDLPPALQSIKDLVLMPRPLYEASEFVLPLPKAVNDTYQQIWATVRQST